MNDQQEVHRYLDRMTSGDPYGAVDAGRLLERGRRARRRRRLVVTGGSAAAAAGVLAAGLAAPSVFGSAPERIAPAAPTTQAQPARKLPPVDPAMFAAPDADDATVLRACSASLTRLAKNDPAEDPYGTGPVPPTTDLTGWRVMARSNLPRIGAVFVALSPDEELAAHCEVYPPGSEWSAGLRSTVQSTTASAGTAADRARLGRGGGASPTKLPGFLFSAGQTCDDNRCRGWMVEETGRVPVKVTRLHVRAVHGDSIDVPVNDGWYALIWGNGDPRKRPDVVVTAYDAAGNVVRPG